jgi:hypothetical protein
VSAAQLCGFMPHPLFNHQHLTCLTWRAQMPLEQELAQGRALPIQLDTLLLLTSAMTRYHSAETREG